MCLAVPAKIIDITEDRLATAESFGNRFVCDLGLIEARVGDYVLVHAGLALEVLTEERANEFYDLYADLYELTNESA